MRQFENPDFIKAVKAGTSRRKMAVMFGVASATIGGWLAMARNAGLVSQSMLAEKLITDDEKETIIQMIRDGVSTRDIASTMKRGRTTIQAIAIGAGVRSAANRRPWSKEEDDVIRQLYPTDTPAAEIAKKLGIGKNHVIGRARRLGLKSPPHRRQGGS